MAVQNIQIVLNASDNASRVVAQAGAQFDKLGKTIKQNLTAGGIAATGFVTSVGLIGKAMLKTAGDFEQNRIAFETMLGSADTAGKLLKEVSDFAVKTPFDMPQVVEGSKQLLAMGASAEEVIPQMKMLGDVSAGLGVPMSRLILNFGQVRAQGKLTGRELRDFAVAGVPILDALVDKFNEQGGSLVTVGKTSDKTRTKIENLTRSLTKQEIRMDALKEAGKESSAAFKTLSVDYEANRQKLDKLGPVSEGVTQRVKVLKKEIFDMVQEGSVSFDDVNEAFRKMTSEGGRFFDLMDKQSKTLQGVLSNTRDEVVRFTLAILGIDSAGNIAEGSLFDLAKKGAEALLVALGKIKQPVVDFTTALLENKMAVTAILGALGGLVALIVGAFLSAMSGAIVVMGAFATAGAAIGMIISKFVDFTPLMKEAKDETKLFSDATLTAEENLENYNRTIASTVKQNEEAARAAEELERVWAPLKDGAKELLTAFEGLGSAISVAAGGTGEFKVSIETLIGIAGDFLSFTSEMINMLSAVILTFRQAGEAGAFLWYRLSGNEEAAQEHARNIFTIQQSIDQLVGRYTKDVDQIILDSNRIRMSVEPTMSKLSDNVAKSMKKMSTQSLMSIQTMEVESTKSVNNMSSAILMSTQNMSTQLVGNSIIPDMVTSIIGWFENLQSTSGSIFDSIASSIGSKFSSLASSAFNWGRDIVSNLVSGLRDKIRGASDSLQGLILGNLGINFNDLLSFDTGGVVPGPIGQPALATVHGGERVTPAAGGAGGDGMGATTLNVFVGMYAGTESEKRNIARELYGALARVARAQGKTVAEFEDQLIGS